MRWVRKKIFEDHLFIEKLLPYLPFEGRVIDYGCGYGRMLSLLDEAGYQNLTGYDFAPKMIERGHRENPHLNLQLLNQSGKIPLETASVDGVVLSTVLCCMVDRKEQKELLNEVRRVLKVGVVVYLTDFLLSKDELSCQKYAQGLKVHGEWVVYTTTENLTVRHHTSQQILDLLGSFDLLWFEKVAFKTMNQNPASTFHAIAKKIVDYLGGTGAGTTFC